MAGQTVDKIATPYLAKRANGLVVIRRECAGGCGEAWPAFGVGVNYGLALKAAEAGQHYKHLLGEWWCAGPGRCRG